MPGGLLRSLVRQPRCSVNSCESQGLSQAELSALGPRFQEPTELRLASKMVMEPAGAPVLPPICTGECGCRPTLAGHNTGSMQDG